MQGGATRPTSIAGWAGHPSQQLSERKEVRTVRRLALLLAGGALWLLLAALPALADGGPHVSTINNGSLGINADSCAGCHRAHTAQGPYLINAADEEALCLTCHGTASTGSTVRSSCRYMAPRLVHTVLPW